jgi:hypothetical protein
MRVVVRKYFFVNKFIAEGLPNWITHSRKWKVPDAVWRANKFSKSSCLAVYSPLLADLARPENMPLGLRPKTTGGRICGRGLDAQDATGRNWPKTDPGVAGRR